MKKDRLYLNSGARDLVLPSGDESVYIDICIEDLEAIIEEHKERVLRTWTKVSENKEYNNIRIFVIPKRTISERDLYPYYLEIAENKKNRNEF